MAETVTIDQAKDLATLAAGATLALRAVRDHCPDQYYNLLANGTWAIGFACMCPAEAQQVADLLNDAGYSAVPQGDSWVAVTLEPAKPADPEVAALKARITSLERQMNNLLTLRAGI